MQAFHLLGPAPFYTNSFLLISDAGHAVLIDPAAEVQEYDKILKEHNAQLTTILCTHGHYDHVGSAGTLRREHKARLYCEPVDCRGTQLLPLKAADVDSGYEEGETIAVDELKFTVWHRACASLQSCPSPVRRSCCPATGIFPPWGRSWTITSISGRRSGTQRRNKA